MKQLVKKLKRHWPLICILVLGAILGLYQLDTLPAEMWNDAIAHYLLADQVRHGNLFFSYRFGGDGPIFTYLVIVLSWIFGLSFYTLKLTSVLIYLLFIFMMYVFAYELFKNKPLATMTSFLAMISFWSITFARQPHARMLVPLFIALTMLFALKKKTILSGLFLGFGMYTQASFWAMPLLFLKHFKILLIGLLLTIPLILDFAHGSIGFFTDKSYFGEKLAFSSHISALELVRILLHNCIANVLAYGIHGDGGFRMNVPDSPHLDILSAFFFFLGFTLLIYKTIKQKTTLYLQYIILPFLIIQIPSLLDIHNYFAQPNIGRMIGVIPFVYLCIAYGLLTSLQAFVHKLIKKPQLQLGFLYGCLFGILLIISYLNITKYFLVYPQTLPNHNVPFGKIIAQTIDQYPQSTTIFVIGSGWGEHEQPETGGIQFMLQKPRRIIFVPPANSNTICPYLQDHRDIQQVVLVSAPDDLTFQSVTKQCLQENKPIIIRRNSYQIAQFIPSERKQMNVEQK